jgi:hypothetical protein
MKYVIDAPRPFTTFGGLANAGIELSIQGYPRSSAANCFFGIK